MKKATQVAIRRAIPNDVDQLTELVEQYRDFYKQERDDKTNQYLTDRISKNESVIFVAEIDGLRSAILLFQPYYLVASGC